MLSVDSITVSGVEIAIAAGWSDLLQAQQTEIKQALETLKYQIFYQQALERAREKVGKVNDDLVNLIYD